jgi:hypothetical protein
MKGAVASLVCITALLLAAPSHAANEITNQNDLRVKFGMEAYPSGQSIADLKVAVLDNGFAGYEPGKQMLPDSAQFVAGPLDPPEPTSHGLGMAQILWSMLGRPVLGPKFYLINTNGYTNLTSAVQFVIDNHVDVVLYSQVWSFGDNFDGKGFINALVTRATQAGVLWINASGNYGGMAFNSPVLGGSYDHLHFSNALDQNSVTVTLSWTDFTDSERYNAVKDLDLFVYDSDGKLVSSSTLVQHGEAPPASGDSNLSSFAREVVTLPSLDRGDYTIQVVQKSSNFTASDQLRVVIDSQKPGAVIFTDHTEGGEILPPADNPNVLTVGERTPLSSVGPFVASHAKPDVYVDDATVDFSSGDATDGSSNAAAMVAGAVVAMKNLRPAFDFAHLERYVQTLAASSNADLLPVSPQVAGPWIYSVVPAGSQVMMARNGHLVVLSPVATTEIPLLKNLGASLARPDDVIVLNPPSRWVSLPRAQAATVTAPLIEFRDLTAPGAGNWVTPAPAALDALLRS